MPRAALGVGQGRTGRLRSWPPRPRLGARRLVEHRSAIDEAGIPVVHLLEHTGFPDMLDHRVVTLHPKVHGGILADRGKPSHLADLEQYDIAPFDMVVSNLYPFRESPDIETIDIGGPAMTRAAAKNHAWVAIVTDPAQYDDVLGELREHGALERRPRVARSRSKRSRAPPRTTPRSSRGSSATSALPEHLVLALDRTGEQLRYGENPHQQAARYRTAGTTSWWDGVVQHSGVALSYLNLYDADAAWRIVYDLGDQPTCAIIKHANPCGVAVAGDLATAYQRALECDERSAFGGIVALNRPIDTATVERMVAGPQADVVIAPGYEEGTIAPLRKKRKNTRLLEAPLPEAPQPRSPPDLGRVPRADAPRVRRGPRRLARRHQARAHRVGVARCRAGVARLRAREVERDRAGEGRPGRRHRRRAAEPGAVG